MNNRCLASVSFFNAARSLLKFLVDGGLNPKP